MAKFVTHPAKPEWGVGEILDEKGNTVRVLFEHAGLKQINLSYVRLQPAEGQAGHHLGGEIKQAANLDVKAVRRLCEQWYGEFGDSLALNVISDLRQHGYLTNGTLRQLLLRCDQEESARLAEATKQIVKAIYGRVIHRDELA
jgi:hypothetical protein